MSRKLTNIGPHTVTYRPRHWIGEPDQEPTVTVHFDSHRQFHLDAEVTLDLTTAVALAQRILEAARCADNLTEDERESRVLSSNYREPWLQALYVAIHGWAKGDAERMQQVAFEFADRLEAAR